MNGPRCLLSSGDGRAAAHPCLPPGAAHRRHLRHHRGRSAAASRRPTRSGATSARDSRRRATFPARPPRVKHVEVAVDDQEYAPVAGPLGAARGGRRALQPALSPGHASQYSAENVCDLGRWARGAHPRGGEPRAHQPRPLLARLHGVRRAARHLQSVHRHPHPARGRARVRVRGRRPAARNPRARALGAAHEQPVQPDRQARRGRGSGALGARRRASSIARSCSTSSTRTTSIARARASSRSRARPATSRTSTAIPSSSSTGSRRTGATRAGASPGRSRRRQVVDALASAGSLPRRRREQAAAARGRPAARGGARRRRDRAPSRRRSAPSATTCLSQLERLGVRVDRAPDGTFYVWGNVERLPAPLNDGMGFFRAALEEKVIVVPGEFFDVNPGKRRNGRASRFSGTCASRSGPRWRVAGEGGRADRAAGAGGGAWTGAAGDRGGTRLAPLAGRGAALHPPPARARET